MTTQILGNVFEHYEEIDSTQTEIHRRIEKCKIQNGTIIMADRKTNEKEKILHGYINRMDHFINLYASYGFSHHIGYGT